MAYENNLKGITVYRNNCRPIQPMNLTPKTIKMKKLFLIDKPTDKIKTVVCPQCGNTIGRRLLYLSAVIQAVRNDA